MELQQRVPAKANVLMLTGRFTGGSPEQRGNDANEESKPSAKLRDTGQSKPKLEPNPCHWYDVSDEPPQVLMTPKTVLEQDGMDDLTSATDHFMHAAVGNYTIHGRWASISALWNRGCGQFACTMTLS
eukprot:5597089-Amphidinium_carterae.2